MNIINIIKLASNLEKAGLYKDADNLDNFIKLSQQFDMLKPSSPTRSPGIGGGGLFDPFASGGQVGLTTGFDPAGYKGKGSNQFMAFTQISPEQIAKMSPEQRMQFIAAQGLAIAEKIAKQIQMSGFNNITNFNNSLDMFFAYQPNEELRRSEFKERFSYRTTQLFNILLTKEKDVSAVAAIYTQTLEKYNFPEMKVAVDNGIMDAIRKLNPARNTDPEQQKKFFEIEKNPILKNLIPKDVALELKNFPRPS